MSKEKKKGNGDEFDDFDVGNESGGTEYEDFDVMGKASAETYGLMASALGGIVGNEKDMRSLMEARDEIEHRMLIDAGDKNFASAADGAARPVIDGPNIPSNQENR